MHLPPSRRGVDTRAAPTPCDADPARYRAHVKRYLSWLRVPAAAAEELTQEVLLVAHCRRGEFRGESSLRTWLSGIAFHLVLNWRRRQRTRRRWEDCSPAVHERLVGDAFAARDDAMSGLLAREVWGRVMRALGEQSDVARQLWLMVAIDEVALSRAGARLGLSEYQADQLFARTHQRMKRELERK